jgi:SRSO17 transposase
MAAEQWSNEDADAVVLAQCALVLDQLYARIAHRFGRVEVRARVRRYMAGLLERVDRMNGWQLAEASGEAGPQGVQRLLTTAVWDAEAVRDDLRAYVVESLGDAASGVLIVDETGFPKKGVHSCGVAPQYCGTLGRSANCQVGVFLGYASAKGMAFLDRALYLPKAWAADHERRATTGVPPRVRFATKTLVAQDMLARAFAAAVPSSWVVADSLYGRGQRFRRWLEKHERAYVVGILPAQVVADQGRRQRATAVAASLPAAAWVRRSAGEGSQGPRIHDWACVRLSEDAPAGMARWLLIRRTLTAVPEQDFFGAYGLADTAEDELVRVAGMRWAIEEGFGQAKGEVGLDQYEVRGWQAWHRQITLCLLAHAALAALCLLARQAEEVGGKRGARPRARADPADGARGAPPHARAGGG